MRHSAQGTSPPAVRFQAAPLLLAACFVGFIASCWALVATSNCVICAQATDALGGVSLSGVGALFYLQLLIATACTGPSAYVRWCVLGAVGIHTVLIILMFLSRSFCPPCVLTAVSTYMMIGILCAVDRQTRMRAALLFPMFVLPLSLALGNLATLPSRTDAPNEIRRRSLLQAVTRVRIGPPVPEGRVRLVIYHRHGCRLCEELNERVLPVIKREYGQNVQLAYRPAWPGLPTPTVIVIGSKTHPLPTLPTVAQLRRTIAKAMSHVAP